MANVIIMEPGEYEEKGYCVERYHLLEEDILRFLDFITLVFYTPAERKNIKSMYLADLLLRLGHNSEILLKDHLLSIPNYDTIVKVKPKRWDMNTYKILENGLPQKKHNLHLAEKFVVLQPTFEHIYPFRSEKCVNWNDIGKSNKKENEKSQEDENNKDVYWWKNYTLMKHNAKFEEANLDIILKALAALFILTIRFNKSASSLIRYGYIQSTETSAMELEKNGEKQTGYIVSSKLFLLPETFPKDRIVSKWSF